MAVQMIMNIVNIACMKQRTDKKIFCTKQYNESKQEYLPNSF